jgi:hypothetical protein
MNMAAFADLVGDPKELQGMRVQDAGFLSTSMAMAGADKFDTGGHGGDLPVRMTINVPSGFPAINVDGAMSTRVMFGAESEVLLPRDTWLRIDRVEVSDYNRMVYIRATAQKR